MVGVGISFGGPGAKIPSAASPPEGEENLRGPAALHPPLLGDVHWIPVRMATGTTRRGRFSLPSQGRVFAKRTGGVSGASRAPLSPLGGRRWQGTRVGIPLVMQAGRRSAPHRAVPPLCRMGVGSPRSHGTADSRRSALGTRMTRARGFPSLAGGVRETGQQLTIPSASLRSAPPLERGGKPAPSPCPAFSPILA